MIADKLKEQIAQAAGVNPEEVALEHPNLESFGDYSTNIAIKNKLDAKAIADKIAGASVAGPGFINIKIDPKDLASELNNVLNLPNLGGGQTWLIEHTSPNPNKAMHLGHLRNNVTGMAIANLWEACGIKVIRDDIDNNRGIAIAKLMWGYKHFKLNSDLRPDRMVDELYVKASEVFEKDEQAQKEIKQMVIDWEAHDPETWKLWQEVLNYSYRGQEMTLKRLGNKWDKVWHEHEHFQKGKDIVEEGLKKGVFRKSQGAIITNLEKYGLPDTVVIKSDGTALYITQDLALTKLKKETFKPDRMFWTIGPEQSLALKQLFAVCEQLGIGKLEEFTHLAYGYMSIKGQGKMSSRSGNVIYIDDLLDMARDSIIKERKVEPILAEKIGVGAVKYSILKTGRMQDTSFDLEESIGFTGNSGPYLQYTYARTRSVLAKSQVKDPKLKSKYDLNEEELSVLRWIYRFSEVVGESALRFSPNLLCNFLYELAQRYNSFYNKHSILSGDNIEFRLILTDKVGQILKKGLNILGIETPETM